MFSIYTDGYLTLNYGWLIRQVDEKNISEFHNSLVKINPFSIIPAEFNRWPSVMISDVFLNQSDNLVEFMRLVEDFGEKIKG